MHIIMDDKLLLISQHPFDHDSEIVDIVDAIEDQIDPKYVLQISKPDFFWN